MASSRKGKFLGKARAASPLFTSVPRGPKVTVQPSELQFFAFSMEASTIVFNSSLMVAPLGCRDERFHTLRKRLSHSGICKSNDSRFDRYTRRESGPGTGRVALPDVGTGSGAQHRCSGHRPAPPTVPWGRPHTAEYCAALALYRLIVVPLCTMMLWRHDALAP